MLALAWRQGRPGAGESVEKWEMPSEKVDGIEVGD